MSLETSKKSSETRHKKRVLENESRAFLLWELVAGFLFCAQIVLSAAFFYLLADSQDHARRLKEIQKQTQERVAPYLKPQTFAGQPTGVSQVTPFVYNVFDAVRHAAVPVSLTHFDWNRGQSVDITFRSESGTLVSNFVSLADAFARPVFADFRFLEGQAESGSAIVTARIVPQESVSDFRTQPLSQSALFSLLQKRQTLTAVQGFAAKQDVNVFDQTVYHLSWSPVSTDKIAFLQYIVLAGTSEKDLHPIAQTTSPFFDVFETLLAQSIDPFASSLVFSVVVQDEDGNISDPTQGVAFPRQVTATQTGSLVFHVEKQWQTSYALSWNSSASVYEVWAFLPGQQARFLQTVSGQSVLLDVWLVAPWKFFVVPR